MTVKLFHPDDLTIDVFQQEQQWRISNCKKIVADALAQRNQRSSNLNWMNDVVKLTTVERRRVHSNSIEIDHCFRNNCLRNWRRLSNL